MALNNRRRSANYLALGLSDPQIVIPETVYGEAGEQNRRSLVGRVLSPKRQDLCSVIQTLPHDFRADGSKIQGRIIGGGKFQFVFEEERDLEMVLWSGPYTYKGWLVALEKWEDEPGPEFLRSVSIWVRIRGIPVRYLCDGTVREIVKGLGEVMEVEIDDVKFDFRFVRVRVNVSVDARLCFKKVVRFDTGEVKIVSLRYEDIAWTKARFKFCHNCGALKHQAKSCSVPWIDVPDPLDRSLSPPPLESSYDDGSAEKNVEGGGLLEQLTNGDGEEEEEEKKKNEDLVGVEEKVGTSSSQGSKRKFDDVEQTDDNPEKRLRGSTDATEGLGVNLVEPVQEE